MASILQTIRGPIAQPTGLLLLLALALLVLRLTANHAHNVVALDDFAVTADLLNGSTYFHDFTPQ